MANKNTMIISHWSTMIEGLDASPKEFFEAVEQVLAAKELPDAKTSRINWSEGGILSQKREYLRIKRKDHAYDICGAPFGNGFFVSAWLGEMPTGFLAWLFGMPIIGRFFESFLKPQTYYRYDTALMFQSLVHSAVLEVIDSMTNAKGLRQLSENDRKPEMRSFFGQ